MDNKAYRQKLADSGQTGDQWQREAGHWFDGSIESVDRRLGMCKVLLARSEEAVAKDLGNPKHLAALVDLQASQRHLMGLRDDLLTASQNKTAGDGPQPPGHPDIDRMMDRRPHGGGGGHFDPDLHGAGGTTCPDCDYHDRLGTGDSFGGGYGGSDECPSCGYNISHHHFGTNHHIEDNERLDNHIQYGDFDDEDPADYWDKAFASGRDLERKRSHKDTRWITLEASKFFRANRDVMKDELVIRAKNYAELNTSTRSVADSRAITAAFVQRVATLADNRPKRSPVRTAAVVAPGPDEWMFM